MVLHGYRKPVEVAGIAARCHAGLLTSFFEGMPCYLLEMLSVGRPMVAIRLPQFDALIEEGVSGHMVERISDEPQLLSLLADRLVSVWRAIQQGRIDPEAVRKKIEKFSVEMQLQGHFDRHRSLVETLSPLSDLGESDSRAVKGPEHIARLANIAAAELAPVSGAGVLEICRGPDIGSADSPKS